MGRGSIQELEVLDFFVIVDSNTVRYESHRQQ